MAVAMQGRQATPERWQKALERSGQNGLVIFQIAGTGEMVVTSGRFNDTVYRTDGVECECEAALLGGDPVCQHRALYRFTHGKLELEVA